MSLSWSWTLVACALLCAPDLVLGQPPTGAWKVNGNSFEGELVIKSVANGKVEGTIYGQPLIGAYDEQTDKETMADRVARLIRQLGDEAFARREAATKELDTIGEPALGALRKAGASDADPEVRRRAERIIQAATDRIRPALAKKDLQKLQGTWYTVSTTYNGALAGGARSDTITYDGNEFVQMRNGQLSGAGTFAIVDPAANPKQIEYTVTAGQAKGRLWRAIYTLDGDDHQVFSDEGNDMRPRDFSGKVGFLQVMKRDKDGPPEIVLNSDLFPTDLQLAESKQAVRRAILKVRPADGGAGTLTLDPNAPTLGEFGDAVEGGKPSPPVKLDCTLKLVKKDDDRRLYAVRGPKVESRLSLVIYKDVMPWGDGRLLVHSKDGQVRYAIDLRLPQPEVRHPPCHPGCFPAGTVVRIAGGTKAIERIREGDLVTTIDADGKASSAKVTGVFVTRNRVLEVRVDGAQLVTTATQPLALQGGGFRAAGELKPGDRIWRWSGERRAATVTALTSADREVDVFNLILGEPTAFVAGGFLVRSKPPAIVPAVPLPAAAVPRP